MRRAVCGIVLFTFSLACGFCADWNLSAQSFTLMPTKDRSPADASLCTLLPSLILEQVSSSLVRSPSDDELLERSRADLKTERLSLFLQLSSAVQERDALVLGSSGMSENSYQKKLKDAEKKIESIKDKLSANLASDQKIISSFEPSAYGTGVKESVKVQTSLFTPSQNAVEAGLESRFYETEISSKKINGLLTGSIQQYSNYIAVTVNLYVFPGARQAVSVTEVGSIQNAVLLSQALASDLLPYITNSLPVSLSFDIMPNEIKNDTVISIDGIVFPQGQMEHSVSAGEHSIEISCQGFNTKTFTYAFTDSASYSIAVYLAEQESVDVLLSLKNQVSSAFYIDGLLYTQQPDGSVHLVLDKKNTIGYMVLLDEEGNSTLNTAFFYIPSSAVFNDASLTLNAKPSDAASDINKRRIWTYRAYTALMLSLPATFITLGNFNSALLAYQSGRLSSVDTLYAWNTARYVSLGITCACGVFFVVELVRYLYTADKVLPSKVSSSPLDTSKKSQGGL